MNNENDNQSIYAVRMLFFEQQQQQCRGIVGKKEEDFNGKLGMNICVCVCDAACFIGIVDVTCAPKFITVRQP